MQERPELSRIDVVFLGHFNPRIFTPAWFSAQDLIRATEAENAKIELIHSDVSIFNLPWLFVQTTRERFHVFTEQDAYFEHIHDIVLGTFERLEHTPIHSLGFNWSSHFRCDSVKEWDSFGYYIVPQAPWAGIFDSSAMLAVEVTEKEIPADQMQGRMQIRVQPSKKITNGVVFNVNEHYQINDVAKVTGCKEIMAKFRDNWKGSKERAFSAMSKTISNFKGLKP